MEVIPALGPYWEPRRIQQRIRERLILEARSADDIIGYGRDGAPE